LVTVNIPEGIEIPQRAGKLSQAEMQRLPKARKGVGVACEITADAIRKNPARLKPNNVDPDRLEALGRMAEQIDGVIVDTETLLVRLRQANTLLDAEAHESLRRVLAFIRGESKFDPRIKDLVPHLLAYFSKERAPKTEPTPSAE
jgi:hypothetical protein